MAVDLNTMNGLAKKRFGDINKAIPEWAVIQEMLPFSQRAKIGELYEELILLTRSQGVTFQRTSRRQIYSLAAARSLTTAPAQVFGCEQILRDQIAYGEMAAAARAGEEAYASALAEVLMSIAESARFYLELNCLYGGSSTGIGVIETEVDGTTTSVLTLTKKSFAAGIWAQMENAGIDVYDPTLVTKRNSVGPITVDSVNFDGRQLNVSGDAADLDAIQPGDVIVPVGANGQTLDGMDKIITNTGTLFNIDAAASQVWRGNTKSAGDAPATLLTYHGAMNMAVSRGLSGGFTWLLNNFAWQDLVDDQTALRRYTEDTEAEMVQGSKSIKFYGANGGLVEFRPHPMVKQGDAFGVVGKDWIRGGESELTNRLPGDPNEDFFHEIPNQSGAEIRNFLSQFILCKKPSHQVKLANILPRAAV
jgi:hypothetical protein